MRAKGASAMSRSLARQSKMPTPAPRRTTVTRESEAARQSAATTTIPAPTTPAIRRAAVCTLPTTAIRAKTGVCAQWAISASGKCQSGKPLKCDDGNICTDDVCQPQNGCVYLANQAGCDDGNGCTIGDICAETACVSGTNICQCATDADCAGAEDNNLCNGTLVCETSAVPYQCVVNRIPSSPAT